MAFIIIFIIIINYLKLGHNYSKIYILFLARFIFQNAYEHI